MEENKESILIADEKNISLMDEAMSLPTRLKTEDGRVFAVTSWSSTVEIGEPLTVQVKAVLIKMPEDISKKQIGKSSVAVKIPVFCVDEILFRKIIFDRYESGMFDVFYYSCTLSADYERKLWKKGKAIDTFVMKYTIVGLNKISIEWMFRTDDIDYDKDRYLREYNSQHRLSCIEAFYAEIKELLDKMVS